MLKNKLVEQILAERFYIIEKATEEVPAPPPPAAPAPVPCACAFAFAFAVTALRRGAADTAAAAKECPLTRGRLDTAGTASGSATNPDRAPAPTPAPAPAMSVGPAAA